MGQPAAIRQMQEDVAVGRADQASNRALVMPLSSGSAPAESRGRARPEFLDRFPPVPPACKPCPTAPRPGARSGTTIRRCRSRTARCSIGPCACVRPGWWVIRRWVALSSGTRAGHGDPGLDPVPASARGGPDARPGWVLGVWVRNLILITLFAGSMHLWPLHLHPAGRAAEIRPRPMMQEKRPASPFAISARQHVPGR